ncbi:MAG TPA: hypothetical protein VFT57_15815 [Gemmatimonadaceae bacterium]|nr:hypothetical protein [Gemmatimonadaceae bacterium]
MSKACPPHRPSEIAEELFGGLFLSEPMERKVWYMCDRCGERCDAPDHHTHSPRAGRKEG